MRVLATLNRPTSAAAVAGLTVANRQATRYHRTVRQIRLFEVCTAAAVTVVWVLAGIHRGRYLELGSTRKLCRKETFVEFAVAATATACLRETYSRGAVVVVRSLAGQLLRVLLRGATPGGLASRPTGPVRVVRTQASWFC